MQNIYQLNATIQINNQLNQQNVYQLRDEYNETMQIMQTYIASNDLALKAINDNLGQLNATIQNNNQLYQSNIYQLRKS